MRHHHPAKVLIGLTCVILLGCGGGPKQDGAGETRSDKAPACGQSKVLGVATEIYDSPQKCADGKQDLKNKAKDDAIRQCKAYCAFLSAKCEMNPELTRDNITVDDYACDKLQDDGKVHARAVAEKDCICKPKS